jgi:hypothetical protein
MRSAFVFTLLTGWILGPWVPSVAAQDGDPEVGSATVVPIQVTGDAGQRFSLVVMGDGYTADEQDRYRDHLDKHLNILWSIEPFRSYRSYINVYSVEIVSGESGITCDPEIGEERETPLGMAFGGGCTNPNARGIRLNQDAARSYAELATPHYNQILALANTDTYGGIGGGVATTSGGNSIGPLITPHELGHSLGRLQDEYTYGGRGNPGGHYEGDEPNSIHHTIMTPEEMIEQRAKWWRWLGEESLSGRPIGVYEGGQGNVSGIWRPSMHSMMISLGYYFDQVSLERMVERISAQTELIAASTPNGSHLASDEVIWIETPNPVYHELEVIWKVNGVELLDRRNQRSLDLSELGLTAGGHTVSATVLDPTDFVRDPEIRHNYLTAERSWTVLGGRSAGSASSVVVGLTAHTQNERAVGGKDVVYVEPTHPGDRVLQVAWEVDGETVSHGVDDRTVNLGDLNLPEGTHRLAATVTDPQRPGGPSATVEWTVDNTPPTVTYELSEPVSQIERQEGGNHYFVRDEFTMYLDPTDDQPGYLVAEFRVNGLGWHHFYGWPDAPPGSPFLFTPSGTNVKELIYGSLSAEGLSPQPWEPREPGWGTHRIEYRGIDAAGNMSEAGAFRVTFQPSPGCTDTVTGTHQGDLDVSSGVICLDGATVTGSVTVGGGASLVAANASIQGTVTIDGAGLVEVVGSSVTGDTRVAGTTDRLTIFGSEFAGGLVLENNRTADAPALVGSTVVGTLDCSGNDVDPSNEGSANTLRGQATGQCQGL